MPRNRVTLLVLAITVAGVIARVWFAVSMYPFTWLGDPTYSYAYRAMLIEHGRWEGLFLMWHPPGYPLLLAVLTWLSAGLLTPYLAGTLLSLVAFAALVVVCDRLAAPLLHLSWLRVAVASYLAFDPNFVHWSSAPLTEALYVAVLYGACVWLARAPASLRRATLVGFVIGLLTTIRLEAAGIAVGFGLALLLSQRATPSTAHRRTWLPACLLWAGWLAGAGWLLVHVRYLTSVMDIMQHHYAVAPVAGLLPNVKRFVECQYIALTTWLPHVALLPYWGLAFVGLADEPKRLSRGDQLFVVAALVPLWLMVSDSIMHVRTGTFLVPFVAIWAAKGIDVVLEHLAIASRRTLAWIVVGVVAMNAVQLAQLPPRVAAQSGEPLPLVQGRLLRERARPAGKVWAFGSEPEVYWAWNQPIVFPFFDHARYADVYRAHRGDPAGFVRALRAAGFTYLTFVRRTSPTAEAPDEEPQPWDRWSVRPTRSDLSALVRDAGALGLERLADASAQNGRASVFLFELVPHDPGRRD